MISALLKPYQKTAAERIAQQKTILLADQPGLGKTFSALGALEYSGVLTPGAVVLVTGPLITCNTAWLPTIKRHMPEVNVIDAFSGSRPQRNARILSNYDITKPNIIVTNHDSIGMTRAENPHLPALFNSSIAAIIIDESHAVLPMEYDKMWDATQFWRGLFELNSKPTVKLRLAISGTPDRGKLHYRFGTWRFLLPNKLHPNKTTYHQWLTKHFFTWTIELRKNGRNIPIVKVGHLKNPENWVSIDKVMTIRRTKAEVAQELPPKRYIDIDVPFNDALSDAYEQFISKAELPAHSAQEALIIALRAKQFAICQWINNDTHAEPIDNGVSPKRDWIIEWLKERNMHSPESDETNSKVVIASEYTRVLNWLKRALKQHDIKAEILSGETPQKRRDAIQQEFQDPSSPLRVVLLSSRLGVGIDLDTADDLIFIDIPLNPDTQEQVEDRIHRVSRMHNVTIWRLRTTGTIDSVIVSRNDETYQETRHLLDGVRNVDFERKIIERLRI